MSYSPASEVFAEAEAKIELAQALYARFRPFAGTPAEAYLTKTRHLPVETIRACGDELRYLPSPIPGRPPQDHAVVSLLRDADGEVCGFQLEFIDIAGQRTAGEPSKQSYALRPGGVRDGLFCAGGEGDVAYVAEGYSCKALAIASLGIGRAYGGGGLNVIGLAPPPERTVVLVPDREPAPNQWTKDGKEKLADLHRAAYARAVDRLLLHRRKVLIAAAPDCGHTTCKDADDFLRKHGAIRLKDLLGRTTPGELSRAGEIKRLAAISSRLDREAEIKAAATGRAVLKGIPIRVLRESVEAERKRTRADKATATDDGAWDEPVNDLAAVLDELVAELGRYIATPATNLDTAALWCAMTHVTDRLQCMPKLAIQSPTRQCGKTTFLDCLSNVVRRPELASGVTEASFIRLSDAWQPTWCLDECDRYLGDQSVHEGLTAAINASSYRRLAKKKICVPADGGKGWDIVDFEFWCPMILAGIRALTDTIQDRSIVLVMQRAKPGELRHRLVNGTSPVLQQLQAKLTRWAKDVVELDLDPDVPAFLHNREGDLWRPLFMLAAEAGRDWPARVLAAAKAVHGQRVEDEVRLAQLLEAIRDIFGSSTQMFTADLISKLIDREDEPWATIKRNGAPIDAYYLRGMLKGVVARPAQRDWARSGQRGRHFYTRADFEEAWARYIPRDPENDPVHAVHPEPPAAKPAPEPPSVAPDQEGASGANPEPRTGSGLAPDGTDSSGAMQALDLTSENAVAPDAPDAPDQIGLDANTYADGNGAADPTATCTYCRSKLNGAAGVMFDGKVFHADACLAEHLKRRARA